MINKDMLKSVEPEHDVNDMGKGVDISVGLAEIE